MPSPLTFGPREWELAYRVALEVLRCPDQAEDAAQDALIQAYRARHSFHGRSKPESWLYRIAFNTALTHLRRPYVRRYASVDVEVAVESDQTRTPRTPEEAAIAAELADSLQDCMCGMRSEDRLAFTERFLLGTSERQLGALLGVSANAAKQRAFRARRAVRSCVGRAISQPTRAPRTS